MRIRATSTLLANRARDGHASGSDAFLTTANISAAQEASMGRGRRGDGFSLCIVVTALCGVVAARPSAQRPLRPFPETLSAAPAELVERLRADNLTYFRFINRAWTARVCEAFSDVTNPLIVRLHGDAHFEQFAVTKDTWGLGDFDDSTRGPSYLDIVRFLGSVDLATRQRGWTRERDALWDRFFDGYRRGLSDPEYHPPEPGIVRELRQQAPATHNEYLAWGESQMQPTLEVTLKSVSDSMDAFDRFLRPQRPDLAQGYFAVVRAGWLRIGVGSSAVRKVLVRVQGPTADPEDDVLIEAKEVANLDGLACLEDSKTPQAIRVIAGQRQLGRLKHDILAVGPTLLIPAAADGAERWLNLWVTSWEPSYRELHLSDLRSPADLGDVAFDAGLQSGRRQTRADPAAGAGIGRGTRGPTAGRDLDDCRGIAHGMAGAARSMRERTYVFASHLSGHLISVRRRATAQPPRVSEIYVEAAEPAIRWT
jgi:hypothetical protein